MAQHVKLSASGFRKIREIDPMLVSYNVEFAEVTGGTFWKAYTPGQIAGTEPFTIDPDAGMDFSSLMQVYPPIDLYNEKMRKLTRALGPAWVRVSGTWSTKTYYDFDDEYHGEVPEGYLNVLTKEQWIGVLDFVKATGTKLKISVANCPGLHSAHEPWTPVEAEKIFRLSQDYGVPISAAEFTNEPNMMEGTGFPKGYTAADYRRDQDLFFKWLKANYPDCLAVGPSTTGGDDFTIGKSGGIEKLMPETVGCVALMDGTTEPLEVFSYHYYNGCSERIGALVPELHWDASEATSEAYLEVAITAAKIYAPLRDKYVPGGQMWVTESGDAGGGGDTWASTYLDVLRMLNELGGFSVITDGVIFHNTLASSDYGYLKKEVFDPRPNYFAVLLWNRLMGTTVYDSEEPVREGAHVYVHSRRDGKEGVTYLIINNSTTEATTVELPKEAEIYALHGENGNLRAPVMTLNGRPLVLGEDDALPDLTPEIVPEGTMVIQPGGCTFIVM